MFFQFPNATSEINDEYEKEMQDWCAIQCLHFVLSWQI